MLLSDFAESRRLDLERIEGRFREETAKFALALKHANDCAQIRDGICNCGIRYAQILLQFLSNAKEEKTKEDMRLMEKLHS